MPRQIIISNYPTLLILEAALKCWPQCKHALTSSSIRPFDSCHSVQIHIVYITSSDPSFLDLDRCGHLEPCMNGASCINTSPSNYSCRCSPGFEGRNCSQETVECQQDTCKNGGTCEVRVAIARSIPF